MASTFFFICACPLQPVTTPEAVIEEAASRTKRERLSDWVLEDETVHREAVDGRRVRLRVAGAAEVVVARGVERDRHDIGRLPADAPGEQHDHDAERGNPFEHPRTLAQSSDPTAPCVPRRERGPTSDAARVVPAARAGH